MRVGDLVVIKKSAVDVGSVWFGETRTRGTHMLVTNIDEDDAMAPIFWRVTLIHPDGHVFYVSADHLEVKQ